MDRFPRGSSAAGAGTAANAAARRLVRPTCPIRPATGADGPVAGGPTTQKGGWRISFTPRPAPLPFRSGAMTPFLGRAGAAAHPKVKRQPPFSAPAAAPDLDYGAVGREIIPARPRQRLRGGCRARCPATATRRPCRRRGRPYPRGQIPRSSARPTTFSRPRPCGWCWWICAGAGRASPCALRGRSGRRRALQGARRGRRQRPEASGVEARPESEHGRDGTAAARRRRRAHPRARGRAARGDESAELLSIDHRFLLVGSASFSCSAEERNVELCLRLDDPALAHGVEKQLRDLEEVVYEQVHG